MKLTSGVQLGLGLIGIGREWGHQKMDIPTEQEVFSFLEFAYSLGVTFFDTAPAYGESEIRFGKFLKTLSPLQRSKILVATKFGEHWNMDEKKTYVDHSYKALCKSFDRSLSILGQINVLQIHKTTPTILQSDDLNRALEYASQQSGILFGASVSDMESAKNVCENGKFSLIQMPYNFQNTNFETAIDLANQSEKWVLINRPYNMGAVLYSGDDASKTKILAYKTILAKGFNGYILTGTKSKAHLQENWDVFHSIQHNNR